MVVCGFLSSDSSYDPNLSGNFTPRVLYTVLGYNSWQWLFLLLGISQVTAVAFITVLEIESQVSEIQLSSFVINLVVLLILVFSFLSLLRGILCDRQNDTTLYIFMMTMATIYLTLEFVFTIDNTSPRKIARLAIAGSLTTFQVVVSRMVAYFSHEYEIVGVAPALVKIYQIQMVLQALLKFDLLSGAIFGLFNVGIFEELLIPKHTIMAIVISYAFLQWIVGKVAVIKEVKFLLLTYLALSTVFLFWTPLQLVFLHACFSFSCTTDQVMLSSACLIAAIILLLNRVLIHVQLMKAFRNFGYGLADDEFIGLVSSERTALLFGRRTRRRPF